MVFLGVAALGPVIARPVSRLLGAPLPALKGMTGTLARANAMRNPKSHTGPVGARSRTLAQEAQHVEDPSFHPSLAA